MQLLQKGVVLHASARKGDEDDGASRFAQQPDFRKGRVFLSFLADAVVGIEKHDIRAADRASLAYSPRTAVGAGRHWLAMKQRAFRPDHRQFKCGDTAFRQGRKTGV